MPEFWEEEAAEDQLQMRQQWINWGLLFLALCVLAVFALWWASSALRFTSSRVQKNTGATYRVWGVVRDAHSGAPVAWAEVTDEPSGHPPIYRTTADLYGAFELTTIAEPHYLLIGALGYRQARVKVGRPWYTWMPQGGEKTEVTLPRE